MNQTPDLGELSGDAATIRGVKYLNYLVHDHGKGVMLMNVTDCTSRLEEVGTIEATYIAHQMIQTIKSVKVFVIWMHVLHLFNFMHVGSYVRQNRGEQKCIFGCHRWRRGLGRLREYDST